MRQERGIYTMCGTLCGKQYRPPKQCGEFLIEVEQWGAPNRQSATPGTRYGPWVPIGASPRKLDDSD